MQACKHAPVKEDHVINARKKDLNQAASYNIQLGLGYLKQGDRSRAKKKLLTAIDENPNSPDANAAMAYYFEQTHEIDQAKKYYIRAISLSSNAGAQLNNYGTFLCRQGEYQKAESYFLKAIKDEQYLHTAGAYENAGLCSLAIPDREKAKKYFASAINQDPSKRSSLYELVKIEEQQGDHAAAIKLLKKYPDLVLNDSVFLNLASQIALNAGDKALAGEYDYTRKTIIAKANTSGVKDEYNNLLG